ncbi:hypothetical protein BC826DRAFT_1102802 [Russula brevipes]|nr:hypothetical protein BC826DRAFT_1102802 [Russula brevipes]
MHIRQSKESIQSYQPSISNSSVHNTESPSDKDSRLSGQSPLPPTSQNSSESSRPNGRDSSIFDHKSCHSLQKLTFAPRNQSQSTVCTVLEAELDPCSTAPYALERESSRLGLPSFEDGGTSSLPSTPRSSWDGDGTLSLTTDPGPSGWALFPADVIPRESNPSSQPFVTAPPTACPPPVTFASIHSPPTDRMDAASRSRSTPITPKGKKGVLGFWSDRRNSKKRPEITTPHNLVHLIHVSFDPVTGEFTGMPKEWLQLLQDSSNPMSDPHSTITFVRFYRDGGEDVEDGMSHALASGGSQASPIPDTERALHPTLSKPIDGSFLPTVTTPAVVSETVSLVGWSTEYVRISYTKIISISAAYPGRYGLPAIGTETTTVTPSSIYAPCYYSDAQKRPDATQLLQHPSFALAEPLRTLVPLIRAARGITE